MPWKAHDLFDTIASFPALQAAGKRAKPGVAASSPTSASTAWTTSAKEALRAKGHVRYVDDFAGSLDVS